VLPRAYGPPPAHGRIRVDADDFRVDEVLGFAADGAGSHALLWVEKRNANTPWVAAQIARAAGVPPRDVGYSGLKDRHAVTRQAFTVPLAADALPQLAKLQGEGWTVLAATAHRRKLRRGAHRANAFRIAVRELSGDPVAIEQRLQSIREGGVPNYFGAQRFGRAAGNLEQARLWAQGGHAPADRHQRGFALSAARSHLFNCVLARRVERGDWNRLLDGEAVALEGTGSYFQSAGVDEALRVRCEALDVHPTAPLWGAGNSPATGDALTVERAVLEAEAALCELLEREGLRHERRATRLAVRQLEWRHNDGTLELAFELARGAFATSVLHEILEDGENEAGGLFE
jgi:tRNA pseudouridine13 synthase